MSAILIDVNSISNTISGWAKIIGISKGNLCSYYHKHGEDATRQRIINFLNGIKYKYQPKNKIYEIGNVVNDFLILKDYTNEYGSRKFDVKCQKCGLVLIGKNYNIFRKKNTCPKHISRNFKHKVTSAESYLKSVLRGMKDRCYNENGTGYNLYGGKGIRICDEWLEDSNNFVNWSLSNGYKEGLTIDRIDSSKDYSPDNCRWITREENSKRVNEKTFLTINGITDSYLGWSKRLNGNDSLVFYWVKTYGREKTINRIKKILDGQNPNFRKPIIITVNGLSKNLTEWSSYLGKSESYFRILNHNKGLEAVKSKIEELLFKQEDTKND